MELIKFMEGKSIEGYWTEKVPYQTQGSDPQTSAE